jgi:hypothetical protein
MQKTRSLKAFLTLTIGAIDAIRVTIFGQVANQVANQIAEEQNFPVTFSRVGNAVRWRASL